MTKYKLRAYFSYIFFPLGNEELEKLIDDGRLHDHIEKSIKQLIQDHRNDLGYRMPNPIKYNGLDMLFKDSNHPLKDVYHVKLLIINKKRSVLELVETISDSCYKDLEATYKKSKIVPGVTRFESARDIS